MPSIAVIGNGYSPVGKGWGAEIDSNDIVIRMHTQTPEKCKSRDYGTKWTWLASALHEVAEHHIAEDTVKVLCVHCEEDYGERKNNIHPKHWHMLEWMPKDWVEECKTIVRHWPSSGCFLLYWLYKKNLLSDTKVYGIDGFKTGHFYDKDFKLTNRSHDMERERPVLEWLIRESREGE